MQDTSTKRLGSSGLEGGNQPLLNACCVSGTVLYAPKTVSLLVSPKLREVETEAQRDQIRSPRSHRERIQPVLALLLTLAGATRRPRLAGQTGHHCSRHGRSFTWQQAGMQFPKSRDRRPVGEDRGVQRVCPTQGGPA